MKSTLTLPTFQSKGSLSHISLPSLSYLLIPSLVGYIFKDPLFGYLFDMNSNQASFSGYNGPDLFLIFQNLLLNCVTRVDHNCA